MASEILENSQIEQSRRPSLSRLKTIALKSGKYTVGGVAAVGTTIAVGLGISEVSASGPGVAQKYENAVIQAINHNRASFVFGGKTVYIKQYEGSLALFGATIRTTPTNDSGLDKHGNAYDNNVDTTHSVFDQPRTFDNPVIVSDARGADKGIWLGDVDNQGDWMWTQPTLNDLPALDPARVAPYSSAYTLSVRY